MPRPGVSQGYKIPRSVLVVIYTSDLQVHALYLPGVPVESVASSPDGTRLYVLSAGLAKIFQLDARSGARQVEIGYADQPYALLHVMTNR